MGMFDEPAEIAEGEYTAALSGFKNIFTKAGDEFVVMEWEHAETGEQIGATFYGEQAKKQMCDHLHVLFPKTPVKEFEGESARVHVLGTVAKVFVSYTASKKDATKKFCNIRPLELLKSVSGDEAADIDLDKNPFKE